MILGLAPNSVDIICEPLHRGAKFVTPSQVANLTHISNAGIRIKASDGMLLNH